MLTLVDNIPAANLITHNGTMHADEVFATVFLEAYLKEITVFRTSNIDPHLYPDKIIYDIGRSTFDHHQLNAQKRPNEIPYSSFGLLWQHFGLSFLEQEKIPYSNEVFLEFDKDFVEQIDAIDNGFFPKIEANYKVKTLSDVIGLFNPSYQSLEEEQSQFLKACEIARSIFHEELLHVIGKVKAHQKLLTILKTTTTNYLILDEYLPYLDTLLNGDYANILFVIFPSNRGGYAIRTIPISAEDKNDRCSIPLEYAGLEGEELEKTSHIKGLNFCHKNRFIMNCDSLSTAIKTVEQIISK